MRQRVEIKKRKGSLLGILKEGKNFAREPFRTKVILNNNYSQLEINIRQITKRKSPLKNF